MKLSLVALMALSIFSTARAQSYTVDSVPNTKLTTGSYVSDPDHILSDETVVQINAQLKTLEDSTTVQVAVVVLTTLASQDIFSFSQDLFTKWGIGQTKKDNGLLILLVKDMRTVRLHTGYGLEGLLPDVQCERIEQEDMVPYFAEENYDKGILYGLEKIVRILTDPRYADELKEDQTKSDNYWWNIMIPGMMAGGFTLLIAYIIKGTRTFADSKKPSKTLYPEMRITHIQWLIQFGIVPFAIAIAFMYSHVTQPVIPAIVLYIYFLTTLIQKRLRMNKVVNRLLKNKKYDGLVNFIKHYQTTWLVWGIFFPLPFLPYFFSYIRLKQKYRNYPRNCRQCGNAQLKLNDTEEDLYLKEHQLFEEKLKSVDYDVWLCVACGKTDQYIYKNSGSKYEKCPDCKTLSSYIKSYHTIKSATYRASGNGETYYECKFCQHTYTKPYSIPMLTQSSSSSGSSGSSSGGSWGGGSSGGGGASSSW